VSEALKISAAEAADEPRRESFIGRWSRVKREVGAGAVPPGTVEAAPVELPSLEALAAQGLEGDFSAFMQSGVDEGLRRAAIQQLFRQPVFNVMDGLDVYIEDFNIYEPLLASELPGLAHARAMLFPEPAEKMPEAELAQSATGGTPDESETTPESPA
jgi:hypothetical protein